MLIGQTRRCSGINVSTNAGSNARTSPDLPDQQKRLTGRSRSRRRAHSIERIHSRRVRPLQRKPWKLGDLSCQRFREILAIPFALGSRLVSLHVVADADIHSNRASPRLQGVRPAVIGLDALIRHTGLVAPYPLAELLADFLVLRMRRILPAAPPLVVEYGTEKCLSWGVWKGAT